MVCLESECTTLILLIGMIHIAGVRNQIPTFICLLIIM